MTEQIVIAVVGAKTNFVARFQNREIAAIQSHQASAESEMHRTNPLNRRVILRRAKSYAAPDPILLLRLQMEYELRRFQEQRLQIQNVFK